jgi:hypothetical protein
VTVIGKVQQEQSLDNKPTKGKESSKLCPTREEGIVAPPHAKEEEEGKGELDDPKGSIGVVTARGDKG